MKNKEKLVDIFLGISLLFWGIMGFVENFDGIHTPLVRWFITFLNLTIGILILIRSSATHERSYRAMIMSLPSVLCGGVLFKLSVPLDFWNSMSISLFLIGGCITVSSFLWLGKNFSIFPRVRNIVTQGLYQIVRHPAYVGEFLMLFACFLSRESWYSSIPLILFFPSIVYRISEEERLLSQKKMYREYSEKVRWRLIPFVW
jgi:protein-S-isoprenylcysteine O-methyltransferase Ste14